MNIINRLREQFRRLKRFYRFLVNRGDVVTGNYSDWRRMLEK